MTARTNAEIYSLYKEADVIRSIKVGRLRWAGHIARMEEQGMPRKLLEGEIYGTRRRGRPKLRWQDGVASDARTMLGIRNWKAAARDRDNWRRLNEEALTH